MTIKQGEPVRATQHLTSVDTALLEHNRADQLTLEATSPYSPTSGTRVHITTQLSTTQLSRSTAVDIGAHPLLLAHITTRALQLTSLQ